MVGLIRSGDDGRAVMLSSRRRIRRPERSLDLHLDVMSRI
jgi:hypothetical protein